MNLSRARMTVFFVVLALLGAWWIYSPDPHQRKSAKREAEIDSRNKVCEKARHAIDRFDSEMDRLSEHEARIALDNATEDGLSQNRYTVLFHYFSDIDLCVVGDKSACGRQEKDAIAAVYICSSRD